MERASAVTLAMADAALSEQELIRQRVKALCK
jgi:hypothetical protein